MQSNGSSREQVSASGSDAGGEVAEPPLRLGAVLARLEEIRRELDRDDLDLEDQLVLYREGCTLAAQAKRILENTQAEVEMLMGVAEESPTVDSPVA